MPELPEVETIRRDLERKLIKKKLKEIHIHNPSFLEKQRVNQSEIYLLLGKVLENLHRKGKYLFFDFEEWVLVFHLGLTGALILHQDHKVNNHTDTHSLLTLRFENLSLTYRDVRRFGKILLIPKAQLPDFLSNIGEDALEISLQYFAEKTSQYKSNIKGFFLNQKFISGLGNIYTDELLFRVKISPYRRACDLSSEEIQKLYATLRELLEEAIFYRGSSLRDYVDGEGKPGRFQERHLVYGKRGSPCPNCGTPLQYIKINQRGTTFCPHCQRE